MHSAIDVEHVMVSVRHTGGRVPRDQQKDETKLNMHDLN